VQETINLYDMPLSELVPKMLDGLVAYGWALCNVLFIGATIMAISFCAHWVRTRA